MQRAKNERRPVRPHRRDAILRAALETFTELGFEAATVSDILRGTDMRSSTFYNYFADKREVLDEILRAGLQPLVRKVAVAREQGSTLDSRIPLLCEGFFCFVADSAVFRALLRRDGGAICAGALRGALSSALLEMMTDEVVEGERVSDDEYLAAAFSGATFELALEMLSRSPCDPAKAASFASNMLLRGIGDAGRSGAQPFAEASLAGASPAQALRL